MKLVKKNAKLAHILLQTTFLNFNFVTIDIKHENTYIIKFKCKKNK
jgi:hypothetical protein